MVECFLPNQDCDLQTSLCSSRSPASCLWIKITQLVRLRDGNFWDRLLQVTCEKGSPSLFLPCCEDHSLLDRQIKDYGVCGSKNIGSFFK